MVCLIFMAIAIGIFSSFNNVSEKKETKIFYGKSQTTQSLDNTPCAGLRSPVNGIYYDCFANAVFRKYEFTVSCDPGWHFVGKPFMNCLRDNQGSCAWNAFDKATDRFYVTETKPDFIRATVWAGSRDIEINLACEAVKD